MACYTNTYSYIVLGIQYKIPHTRIKFQLHLKTTYDKCIQTDSAVV